MRLLLISLLLIFFASVNSVSAQTSEGFASIYPRAYEGTKTASGEIYNSREFTARHSTLPFNTLVKVTNLKNNRSVTVRINDRFNYKNNRVIDISKAASKRINLFGDISPKVKIEVIGMADALMLAAIPTSNSDKQTAQVVDNKDSKISDKDIKNTIAKADSKKKDTEKIKTPTLLPSVKVSLPSVSLKEISNLATVTLEYITISLLK